MTLCISRHFLYYEAEMLNTYKLHDAQARKALLTSSLFHNIRREMQVHRATAHDSLHQCLSSYSCECAVDDCCHSALFITRSLA